MAQTWAQQCNFAHDANRNVGIQIELIDLTELKERVYQKVVLLWVRI